MSATQFCYLYRRSVSFRLHQVPFASSLVDYSLNKANQIKQNKRITMRKITSLLALLLRLLAANGELLAQVGTEGAILGVVTDSTGAVVAGAEVTVTNLDTGLKKTMVTDSGGNFEILALPRGPYSVSVSLVGFKTWAVVRTELTVGERKRFSPVLEVGEVTQRITVEATTELIQTEKGSVESVIEEKQIRELPLNGRNPVELVRLVPGVRYLGKDTYDQQSYVQG